ncbi:MAG: tetratricopeptide repeat protein [Clostridiaceae bacterium]|nr:tetratricopeptide repeat protein [Clostridiaceae bacterium]
MNFFENVPTNYNVSLAFIVFMIILMTVYMAVRSVRRLDAVSIILFAVQLCALTMGVLTVIDRVLAVPLFEIIIIVFGLFLPGTVLISDYIGMKKRIKKSLADAPLIEKIERQSHGGWKYSEFIDEPNEWKSVIKAADIAGTLNLDNKKLKSNVNKQLTHVDKLINDGEIKQALEIYTVLSGLISDNPFIIYNTAWLSYKNGLYEDAIQICKKALHLTGDTPLTGLKNSKKNEISCLLRPMIHFCYGLCLFKVKKYLSAIDQFIMVQNETDGQKEADVNIAKCYLAIGEIGKAQEHIRKALKLKDDNILRYFLARLCFEKNEEMECKYQLETIVEKYPEFTEAWYLLAKLYRKRGDWENALIAYKKLTQLAPQDAEVYYRLGIAQRHEGKTEEALSNFKFAAEINPDFSRAYYSMASIYDAAGKTDKAIECLEKSLMGDERLEMAYNLLAEIYISKDRILEAIRVYDEAIRVHPESYLVHFNLGVSLMMMKRYEEAVRVFRRAEKLTNDDPALYYNWASAEISLKNYSEAARLYKEGLKLKSDDDEILFGLARVSALSGDVDATIGFLTKAIEINPDLRLRAKASTDFSAFRTHPQFIEITKLPIKRK